MGRITNEVRDMYHIFLDSGDFERPDTDWPGMTGDYEADIYLFAEQYKEFKTAMRQAKDIEVDYDEQE